MAVPHPGAHGSVVEENGSVASHKHGLPVLVDDVIVNPGGNNHVKHDPGQDVFEERPVEDGKLAEPPDCHSPDRRCNLTNAAITSTTLLVDDIRIRRCCQRCTRVLQSHLKQLRRERSKTDALLKITLSSMQLYFVPPSYGRSGAHGRYSTG